MSSIRIKSYYPSKEDVAPLTVEEVLRRTQNSTFCSKYDFVEGAKELNIARLGIVLLCRKKFNDFYYAVKICRRFKGDFTEQFIVQHCEGHLNVMKYHECMFDDELSYLVTDVMYSGDLAAYIRNFPMNESDARQSFTRMVSAMLHLRKRHVHGNAWNSWHMMSLRFNAAINLIKFSSSAQSDEVYRMVRIFSPQYSSPEQLLSSDSEVWSLGAALYEALCGMRPFKTMLDQQNGIVNKTSKAWSGLSVEVQDLLTAMLQHSMWDRCSLGEVSNHVWLTGKRSLRSKMLSSPATRLRARQSPTRGNSKVRTSRK